jgi:2-polyprenyl-3-methyl-5-hydroxy-6-metoxy-1,4-benzoquinol methylase
MEISDDEFKKIKGFITKFNSNDDFELEFRLCNKEFQSQYITLDVFNRLVSYLTYTTANGGLEYKYSVETTLDIKNSKGNERITIIGKDNVKKYWIEDKITDDMKCEYTTKEKLENYDIQDYGLRVGLSKETTVKKIGNISHKTFRMKNRYSILDPEENIRFDLTAVKSGEANSFKKSTILQQAYKYEVEIEILNRNIKDSDKLIKQVIYYISLLYSLIQDFNIITKYTDSDKVINIYKSLINYKNNKKHAGNIYENTTYNTKFITASPITLHPKHLIQSEHNVNILTPYAVTLKADGQRKLLIVGSGDLNGRMYILDINMNVNFIGYENKEWSGSIIEGEYMSDNNVFYIYDMLFSKGSDIRGMVYYKHGDSKTRLHNINEFIKSHEGSTCIINDLENSIVIKKKEMKYSLEDDIFSISRDLWEKRSMVGYNVDGLIFTPLNDHYPIKGGGWHSLFKWKPAKYNSIDFLIEIMKDDTTGLDIIKTQSIYNPVTKEYESSRYKTALLYVGANKDKYDKVQKKYIKNTGKSLFNPFGDATVSQSENNVAKLFIDIDDNVIVIDPINSERFSLTTDIIVEFYYERMDKDKMGWNPIRVRYDKTKQYKNGESVYGNFENTANDIWKSIQNPVTDEMLFDGIIDKEAIELKDKKLNAKNTTASYYKCIEDVYDPNKRLPVQNFHNLYVKRNIIIKYAPSTLGKTSSMTGRLLDLACGKGGDLSKWRDGKYKEVVSMDIDKPCITYAMDFFKKYPQPKPVVNYLWADTSKLIFPDQLAGLNDLNQKKMAEWIPDKYRFNVVSCQFCIHYYFENEIKLRTLLQNVTDNLEIGGHFIGTCFDGVKIFEYFKENKVKFFEGTIKDDIIWKITKDYKSRSFESNKGKSLLGQKIQVYIKSIGETHIEYLINLKYFEELISDYGFELVEYKDFGDYHNDYKSDKTTTVKLGELSSAEREFSFLNTSFCFRKVKATPDKEYKTLQKLIAKNAK